VLARSAEGNDLLLAHTGIGDLLGELTMFDHGPRSATVEAAEDADIVWLPGEAVIEVIRAHPDVAEELLRQLAETVRRVSGMVADLVFLDVPRRVAKFVLEHADGRGVADLGMSQGELAAAVGGVRQSVNTALRGLERRGWIRMEGRTIRIGDRDALAEFAGVGES
jgi:CRP-like cAMP-binding protein